jgi:hypothetical protein
MMPPFAPALFISTHRQDPFDFSDIGGDRRFIDGSDGNMQAFWQRPRVGAISRAV